MTHQVERLTPITSEWMHSSHSSPCDPNKLGPPPLRPIMLYELAKAILKNCFKVQTTDFTL